MTSMKEQGRGRDGIGIVASAPVAVLSEAHHHTEWSIQRWNRRGLRCTNHACRHEIVEHKRRQYDPYDERDGLIFGSAIGKKLAIVRTSLRRPQVAPSQPDVLTLGNRGLLGICPRCHSIMESFAPDKEEGRLPDAIDHMGNLVFDDPIHGNLLLDEGVAILWALFGGIGTEQAYDNATAQVGTGTSATAAAATDTDLLGSGVWKDMEATFPSIASQTISFKGSYATGDANQAWNEFSVRNGATADENINRVVSAKGTKSSGVWTLEVSIELN